MAQLFKSKVFWIVIVIIVSLTVVCTTLGVLLSQNKVNTNLNQSTNADYTYTDTYGDWTYTVSGTNATITKFTGTTADVVIPSTITKDGTTYTVKALYNASSSSNGVFYGVRSTLQSITIPNTITSIGNYAFYQCIGLTSVAIGNSVTSIGNSAFYGCTGLTSVTIPNSVTSIGKWAFYCCRSLTSVTLGNSVTSIGDAAFYCCYKLLEVINKSSLTITAGSLRVSGNTVDDYVGYYAKQIITDESQSKYQVIDNIKYYIDSSNNNEYIAVGSTIPNPTSIIINNSCTEINAYAFGYCRGLTSVTIPDSVTSIGGSAFASCTSLTSVTIPNSVTSIGNSAFNSCTGLTSVTIPNSVTTISGDAFSGCTGLTSVTIPDSVTSIGGSAFSHCTGLTSVTIPDSVTSIGQYAFYGCSGLTSVCFLHDYSDGVQTSSSSNPNYIGKYAFYDGNSNVTYYFINQASRDNAYNLSNRSNYFTGSNFVVMTETSGTYTDSYGTWNYTALGPIATITKYTGTTADVTIPSTFTQDGTTYTVTALYNASSVSNGVFYGVRSTLQSITIPNTITTIGNSAFYGCSGLTSVTIPNSVTSIGNSAFYGCGGLTSVTLGNSVTSIGNSAFSYCYGLTSVTIGNSVTSIGEYAFCFCYGLTSVTIGNSVTSIGSRAFYDCNGLTSVTIPNSVTSIGNSAFSYCTGITSVTLGNSVTSIGISAFYNCRGLTSVTIGNSVTSIGSDAFRFCTGLTSVTIGNSVTSIGEMAFYNCYKLLEVINKSSLTITAGSSRVDGNTVYDYVGYYAKQIITDESQSKYQVIDNIKYYIDSSNNNEYIAVGSTIPNPTSIIINNSCTEINAYAFGYCTGLTSVTIPNSVTSIGNYAFYECRDLESIEIPNSVTSIGGCAFGYCTGLTSVTIPNSVTSIGNYAFEDCTGLTSVCFLHDYSDGVQTSSSSNPNYIGKYAFYDGNSNVTYYFINQASRDNAYNLSNRSNYFTGSNFEVMTDTSGTYTDSYGTWNYTAFGPIATIKKYTGTATDVVIPSTFTQNGTTYIVTAMFDGTSPSQGVFYNKSTIQTVTIPNGMTNIGGYAFYNCSSLTGIYIPDSATYIGNYAFYGCTKLFTADIGEGIQTIGNYAFYGCQSLTSIVLPDCTTSIGNYVFGSAWQKICGLTSITLGRNLSTIGNNAFEYCYKLLEIINKSSLDIVAGANTYGSVALRAKNIVTDESQSKYVVKNNVKYYIDNSQGANIAVCSVIPNPTSITLDEDCKETCFYAFAYITTLTSVTIPFGFTKMGSYTFNECSGINSVTMPNSITMIGDSVFSKCTSLTSVTIPGSVTSIGLSAFLGCTNLSNVYLLHDYSSGVVGGSSTNVNNTPNYIGVSAFTNNKSGVVYYFINQASRDNMYNVSCTSNDYTWNRDSFFTSNNFSVLSAQFNTEVSNSAWGTISGNTSPALNASTTLTATPNTNYIFKEWLKNGESFNDGSQSSITVTFTEYVTYTAVFEKESFVITAIPENNIYGSVSGGGTYKSQLEIQLTATANSGYIFSKWQKDGQDFEGNTSNPLTIIVTDNVTYTALFVATCTITTSVSPNGYGTVSAGGEYVSGTNITITATPNYGYVFTKWQKDGQDFANNTTASIEITVTADATYTAIFEKASFVITANANNSNYGSVTGGNTYLYQEEATLTATPNDHYVFVKWQKDGADFDNNNTTTITITVVGNATYTAVFEIVSHNISITNLTPTLGSVSGDGAYQEGTQTTLTATPNTGAKFFYWLKNGQVFAGSLSNPLTITVTEDVTYTACFAPADYNPEISSPNSVILETEYQGVETTNPEVCGMVKTYGYGSLDGVQTVRVEAIATSGYRFVGWKINGETTISAKYTSNKADILLSDIPNSKIIIAVFDKAT